MWRRRRRLAAVATSRGQVATWTVLFTDMVGSTEMRVRVGEGAFDRVRADLDRRVARSVAAHAGAAVKSTGDGVMAAFEATASALRCATAIQGAVADHNRQTGEGIALRVGISVGDAVVDGGDLQGTAVVEAARLCAVAEPGTVLCSEAVRSVSANRSGCVFGEPRSIELKGLPVPVVVHEVVSGPSADRADGHGLSFGVLGPLEVERDGRAVAVGGPKERLVLALLLASAGTVVSVDALVDAVWGERPPRTAERTIHAYIARLRRALEPRHATRRDADRDRDGRSRLPAPRRAGAAGRRDGSNWRLAPVPTSCVPAMRSRARRAAGGAGPVAGRRVRRARRRRSLRAEANRLELPTAARRSRTRSTPISPRGRPPAVVAEVEAAVAAQPFREQPLGSAHGRPVPIGAPGRRPRRLPARPARAGRGDGDRAGPGAAPSGGGDPRPGPRPRLDAPAGYGRRSPVGSRWRWPPSARRSSDGNTRWSGCGRRGLRPRAATAGSCRSSAPRAPARRGSIAELARDAHGDGAAVLYGRCDHAHQGARALVDQALGRHRGPDRTDRGRRRRCRTSRRPSPATCRRGHAAARCCSCSTTSTWPTPRRSSSSRTWPGGAGRTPLLVVGAFRSDGTGRRTEHADMPRRQLPVGSAGWSTRRSPTSAESTSPTAGRPRTSSGSRSSSDGIPLLVHEQASTVARDRTARRVEQAAGRLAATRGRLLTSRARWPTASRASSGCSSSAGRSSPGVQAQQQAVAVAVARRTARTRASPGSRPPTPHNFFGRERLGGRAGRSGSPEPAGDGGRAVRQREVVAGAGRPPPGVGGRRRRRRRAVAHGHAVPGRTPHRRAGRRSLTERVGGGRRRWPCFVDQFEEMFTLGAGADEQVEFVDRLVSLAREPRRCVVLAGPCRSPGPVR